MQRLAALELDPEDVTLCVSDHHSGCSHEAEQADWGCVRPRWQTLPLGRPKAEDASVGTGGKSPPPSANVGGHPKA
jgi:hypothetical protein